MAIPISRQQFVLPVDYTHTEELAICGIRRTITLNRVTNAKISSESGTGNNMEESYNDPL